VQGPRSFLRALYEECDGSASIPDLHRRRAGRPDAGRFTAFVCDMLRAGVLIDATTVLGRAFDAIQLPTDLGGTADRDDWVAARSRAAARDDGAETGTLLAPAKAPALLRLLDDRCSATGFGTRALRESELAALLDAMYGMRTGGSDPLPRRSVASAGGFKSLRLSLMLWRAVGTLAPGVFAVDYPAPGRVGSRRVAEASSEWCAALLEPHHWAAASGLIAISADIRAATLKYRNRALQFALLEAGSVLQNAGLAAADLGIALRALGGYYADRVATACRITAASRILCCAVVGTQDSLGKTPAKVVPRPVVFRWMNEHTKDGQLHIARAEIHANEAKPIVGWGRSIDARQAGIVAIAEASERYSYSTPGDRCLSERAEELDRMVAPESLARYAESQYRSRYPGVHRFDPSRRYLWVRAYGQLSGEERWVPAEFVYPLSALPGTYARQALTRTTSSGCASDATPAVAIERAGYEVIERDALARHWLAQRPGTAVASGSCGAPVRKRIDALERAGCRVALQVLDAGLGPVALALVTSDALGFSAIGTACGDGPAMAFERALGEAEVIALSRLRGVRARAIRASEAKEPMDHAELHSMRAHYRRAWVLLQNGGQEESVAALARRWSADLATRLAGRAAQDEPLWIDLTAADAPVGFDGEPLVTVRVLIPGCLPIAFGFDAIPRGGITCVTAAGRFPHPMA
jgi:ribosomal protein S12 methylthiotransferase accessory factor